MVNLRIARKEAGLTQVEIAKKINVSQQCYSDYENGKTDPDMNTLVMIADLLQVSTDYLLGRTDDLGTAISFGAPALSTQEQDLLRGFRRLLPKTQKHIIDIVHDFVAAV